MTFESKDSNKEYDSGLTFTGERVVPGKVSDYNFYEAFCRYEFVRPYVKDKIVLDAGCGQGYGSFYLSQTAKEVFGIDIAANAIHDARKNYKRSNLCFKIMDVAKMEFPDNFFDVICSFEVIEHLENYKVYLTEIGRVLKPSGFFLYPLLTERFLEKGRYGLIKENLIWRNLRKFSMAILSK